MRKSKIIFGVLFSSFLLMGACGALLQHKENKAVEVKADAAPNNMFGYIYNDSFNNQNNSLTLFVFEGTATGLSENYNIPDTNKVKLNGVGLDSLGGSIAVWGDHNWVQVSYPTSSVYNGATLEIESGLTAGDAVFSGCKFTMDSTLKWSFDGFNDSATATYQSIPYAAYNTNAQLLIQFSGGGKLGGDKVTNAHDIVNYDKYVTINGIPFSSLSGAEIRTWSSNQPWLWLRFPAASNGDVLRIERGMRFYSEVFDLMTFVFDGSAWVKKSMASDDPDVVDSDYKIFTISDYNFAVNDPAGFMFYSSNNYVDAMSDSFCFCVNVRKTDLSTNMVLRFAGTDIYGSGAIIKIDVNFSSNAYLTFNGTIDWSTNISPVWETNVDYLVEVYAIRTSNTSCAVLFARDGEIIWKSTQDATGLTFNNYFTTTGTANTASDYSSPASTVSMALNRFGVRKLSANKVGFDDNRETGACLTSYAGAKAYYNSYLTQPQKTAFANNAEYAQLKARLVAWAAANGETFNPANGTFSAVRVFGITNNIETNSAIIIVVAFSLATLTACTFFIFRRKQK